MPTPQLAQRPSAVHVAGESLCYANDQPNPASGPPVITMASEQPAPPNPPPPPDSAEEHGIRISRQTYHAQTVSMTDFGSDDGESALAGLSGNRDSRRASGPVLGMTGAAGESGLPPSRPSTAQTGVSRAWSQAGMSRARGTSHGAPSVGSAAMSRPPTAGSKTHVPSLTSHAFFKPMSSQRLQAQRGQRMSMLGRGQLSQDLSGRKQQETSSPDDTKPPLSRDTDVTEHTDGYNRENINPSPDIAETVRSRGESIAPLRKPSGLAHLNIEKANKNGSASNLQTPSKSPRSFRSSFALPSRKSKGASSFQQPHGLEGHEKLSSSASSQHYTTQEQKRAEVKGLGKNYEYFDGNTVFCWGGRLQNTRDRPINIFTGLAVAVPAALFFGFS